MSDILDLIDHAIADHGWDMSDDAMRWSPAASSAKTIAGEFEASRELLRSIIWPELQEVVRRVSAIVNQEPLHTLLADRLWHERRMTMWRRKARAIWPRWTR